MACDGEVSSMRSGGANEAAAKINRQIYEAITEAEKLIKAIQEVTADTDASAVSRNSESARKSRKQAKKEKYELASLKSLSEREIKCDVPTKKSKKKNSCEEESSKKSTKYSNCEEKSSDRKKSKKKNKSEDDLNMDKKSKSAKKSKCQEPVDRKKSKSAKKSKHEESSPKTTVNTSIQAGANCLSVNILAKLVITKPDGKKSNIQLRCEMPNYKVERVIIDGQEFRRVD